MGTITPFRYPGAKNKLLKFLNPHIDEMITNFDTFVDVFVGGGSVALEVAKKYPNLKLILNDKDKRIYAFWKIISMVDDQMFYELIFNLKDPPTIQKFNELRLDKNEDLVSLAHKAIFFNRTSFSGILDSGPIGGYGQKGKWLIGCRYNAKNLIKKIHEARNLLIARTEVKNLDFSEMIDTPGLLYIDPPYFIKGDMLYKEKMNKFDHLTMSLSLKNKHNWILSYDNHSEIRKIYDYAKIEYIPARYSINGKKENWTDSKELIITNKEEK